MPPRLSVTKMRPLPLDESLMVPDSDRALFGDSPQHLLDTSPAIAHLQRLTFDLIGMMLLAFGVSQMAIAWFALRHGQWWGLEC